MADREEVGTAGSGRGPRRRPTGTKPEPPSARSEPVPACLRARRRRSGSAARADRTTRNPGRSAGGVRDQSARLGGGRTIQDPLAAGAKEPIPQPIAAQPKLEPAASQAVAPCAHRTLAGGPVERGPPLGEVGG